MVNRTKKSTKRYHKDVFYPPGLGEKVKRYMESLTKNSPLVFSTHSVDKIVQVVTEYGTLTWKNFIRFARKSFLDKDKIFEVYEGSDGEITKACFRYSFEHAVIDIILVISRDGVIITVYPTNKDDTHRNMNRSLYESK